jgi:drug/metabolite transporter (DMT)-like permease
MPLSRRSLWLGAACALAVLVIWTSFILIARASATRPLPPLDIAWLRFAFAGLIALPVLAWRGWQGLVDGLGGTPRVALVRMAALSLTAGIGYCGFAYAGFFYAPVSHGAVLMPGSLPLWTALLAVWVLGERLRPMRVAGLGLIAAGGLLVGGQSLWLAATDGGEVWRGDVLFILGGICWATYGVLCRRWRIGALDATLAIALGCLASAVPLYAVGVASGAVPSRLWGAEAAPLRELLWQAVFQGGVAMWLAGLAYTQVVGIFGPVRATMMTSLVPPLAAVAAVPLLGEALTAAAVGGLACVTAGLLLGLRAGSPAATKPLRATQPKPT